MVIIKDKIKLKIVEHTKEVLSLLINDIGKNLKPDEDIVLIRFDTYADFLVPKDIKADEIETSDNFVSSVDNQCWILPAVYRGYVKKIFWFKPPWAHQFQDGFYQLQIGKCQQTGLLKVASTIPYFTSNCVYSSNEKLSNIHTVDIYISTSGLAKNYSIENDKNHASMFDNETLDNDNRKKVKLSSNESSNHKDSQLTSTQRIHSLNSTILNQLLENKLFLIDINSSFFSTDDSIRKQFDEQEYEILRYVYTRIVQEQTDAEILQYISARESALEQIRTLMNEYLTDPKIDQPITVDNIYLSALITVIRYKKLDWKLIHNYGMHLADTRPPLHVSSEGMIIYLLESMNKVLESISKNPIFITISRCVDDGFCSLEQADFIQIYLEKKLRKIYKIDEFIGKSLSKSLTNDDDNEDEIHHDDNNTDKKVLNLNNDENNHRLNIDKSIDEKTNSNETGNNMKISGTSKFDINVGNSTTNRSSTSPPKSNLSPGELKTISPSSLSETSLTET